MEISLAVICGGTIGLLASFSSGFGAGFKFFLFYVAAAAVLGWVLSVMARRQQDSLVGASSDVVTAAVRETFSGVGWKQVNGAGTLNFRARGFGFGGFKAKPPVVSVQIEAQSDGTTMVSVWTSQWHSQVGMMALCDRVVSKRFRLERKLAALASADPPTAADRPTAAAGARVSSPSPSSDAKAVLADPGLSEDDPRQLAHGLLTAAGLSFLVYGPADAGACFEAFAALSPVLLQTELQGGSDVLGGFSGQPGFYWLCFESRFGSAIAVIATPDGDANFSTEHFAMRLRDVRPPWQWGLATVGGNVPAGFAQIVDSAHLVELPRLPRLQHLAVEVPPQLQADLQQAGWVKVGDGGFKVDVALDAGRNLAVFFSPYNAESFGLIVPIDKDEYVPAEVRTRSFGRYHFDVVGEMAVLCRRFPTSEPAPSADILRSEAHELAHYTHRQFAGESSDISTSPAGAPTNEVRGDAGPAPAAPTESWPPTTSSSPTSAAFLTRTGYADALGHGYACPPDASDSRGLGTPTERIARPGRIAAPPKYAGVRLPQSLDQRRGLFVAAGLAVVIVFCGIAMTWSDNKSSPSPANAGIVPTSGRVNSSSPCSSPPALRPQSTSFGPRGFAVSTSITSTCPGGDLLSNNRFRATVVNASGQDVASGVFDLSSAPIAVGGDTSVTFTFPAGTYWTTRDYDANQLRMTAHKDGTDYPPPTGVASTSTVTATEAGMPETGQPEAVALAALRDIASSDRAYIDAKLLNAWEPQLSSKRPGLVAEGITWDARAILREYMSFRQRFPSARLVWSGDWPVFSDPTWWITVAGLPFGSGADANGWCASQGFDADHCFAKILSHDMGSSGTTLGRK